MTHALILGGGAAGLTAAFELLDRGFAVELFEARREPGGRVFSFADRATGQELDNGPHVLLGCYRQFRGLLRRIGSEDAFRRPRRLALSYREPGGRRSELSLARLPVPLAMPAAVLGMRGLRLGQRLRGLRGMVASLRGAPADQSFADWLARHRQLDGPDRFLWLPLCLAVMNSEPEETSARLFLATLRRAFSGSAAAAAIWIPTRPWSRILGAPAAQRLREAGAAVHTGRRVASLELDGDRVRALGFADGSTRELGAGDLVVSALPAREAGRLLPEPLAAVARGFGARSIVNVYFDYGEAAPLPDEGPLVTLVGGRPFQFVYRRPGDPAGRFALIASAPAELDGQPVGEIAQRARRQLALYYPESMLDDSARVRVTKEARATVLASPAAVARRPAPGLVPGAANLLVCGDWTDSGLPSTLEGAAESAVRMVRALGR